MKYILALLISTTLLEGVAARCYKCAASFADPHIKTFDEEKFQCQGQGDFIMAKSKTSDFELQARFSIPESGLHDGRNGSSTVGAVINTGVGKEAKVELKVTPAGFPATSVHDCSIDYYVNDERKEFQSYDVFDSTNRFYFARRTVENHGWPYSFRQFQFYDSGTIFWASKAFDEVFGCYMNLQLCLPCDMAEKDDIVGLFGSPNDNKKDDFATRSGELINHPPKMGEETTYCQENWCVGGKQDNLFETPDKFNRCTSDTETDWEKIVEEANDEIKEMCEGEVNCIVDTIVTGDIDTGLRTLEEAKEVGFVHEIPDPTDSDRQEEDDSYTCSKAGADSETAFARSDDGSGCFLDDGHQKWGWTIEIDGTSSGSYEQDVWAGADGCDTSKGKKVGKVIVTYDEETKECTGDYLSIDGYTLQEFQFYCGAGQYPTVHNLETVSVLQYPCKHDETKTKGEDTCVVKDVISNSGKVHAIAHAVSCDTGSPPEEKISAPPPAQKKSSDIETRSFNAPPKSEQKTEQKLEQKTEQRMEQKKEQKMTQKPEKKKGSGSGDPHFKTWTGDKYDYHGECDLVLLDNPSFADGLGLRLHIRTTRVKYFSFIERAALQIGNNTLEFDNDLNNILIDGEVAEFKNHHKTMLGDYWVRKDPKAVSVRIKDNGRGDEHRIKIDFVVRKNGFPGVIVDGGGTDVFKGSLGLLGDWETGKKLARDGATEIEVDPMDAEAFALEWQVRDSEPMLFQNARFPQFPTTCIPAVKINMNRLGAMSLRKEAEEACSHWKDDMEDCIFDVIATRDVLTAEEGHFGQVA